ncbi:hypothetical protein Ahy_B10g102227 isoform D [Arachis hypogaea]|uniref:Uncharacterized protein n=1 Tax=Arachis hypogaea TaxID=3818 RepID=A0A444X1I8_ARAHY|nr:hypothetical protein Ahy_B10g102227 isoform D [Arachis hypogaea]
MAISCSQGLGSMAASPATCLTESCTQIRIFNEEYRAHIYPISDIRSANVQIGSKRKNCGY